MTSPRYTVVLRGNLKDPVMLSKNQIQHDSPDNNYFASCFLAGFMEAESKTVELDQDPALFALIVQHMSGYRILPLSPNSLPPGMTKEVTMENLIRDAKFFGLEGLYKLLTQPETALPPHIQGWEDYNINGPVVEFEDVIHGRLPPGTLYTQDGLCTMVDGIARPVLVYGRNMPLDILWEWVPAMEPDESSHYIYKFNLQLLPLQAQNLEQRHAAWPKKLTSVRGNINWRLKADSTSRRDTSIRIDGRKALLKNLSLWLDYAHLPPQERIQQPRYEEFRVFDESFPDTMVTLEYREFGGVLHLWGDGFFFLIHNLPGLHDWPDGSFELQILDIRARTCGAIMEAAFPPL